MGQIPPAAVEKVRRYCEQRTPPQFRDRMYVEISVRGRAISIYDCSLWPDDPPWWMKNRIAQIRYDLDVRTWALYYSDRNDRLHPYWDFPPTASLARVLAEIDDDPTCIFWG